MTTKPTVLITGASGFVGGRLAETYHLSDGIAVRAGIRSWPRAARLARFPMDIALCDIMKPDQIAEAITDATAVVHCAYTDNHDIIVQGTKNMLEAALASGVERFVYLSTAEVYGSDVHGTINETTPYQYTDSVYGDAKIDAEKLCWEYHERGLPVTILRPSIVYGPFSGRIMKFTHRLQSGKWGMFQGFGEGICNLVYVDDLISAISLALHTEGAVGEAFNINGPDTVTWNNFFQSLNDALALPQLAHISSGQSALKSAMRDRMNTITGAIRSRYGDKLMDIYLQGGAASNLMKGVKNALFTTPSVRELEDLYSRDVRYVDDKAKELLGYTPQFDVNAGLNLCALWLEHHSQIARQKPKSPEPVNGNAYIQGARVSGNGITS